MFAIPYLAGVICVTDPSGVTRQSEPVLAVNRLRLTRVGEIVLHGADPERAVWCYAAFIETIAGHVRFDVNQVIESGRP